MSTQAILEGLNEEQRRAVEAVRGPVCILAGAGSGKTTTITRRIAYQVMSRTFEPQAIMAVTFTDRAAGEMRARLARLGVEGVRARTFHSAALAQLRSLAQDAPPQILDSKAVALRQLANNLPRPYRFRPAGDLATEIEWAKNRRLGPETYLDSLGDHQPPIPKDLMASIYQRYERGKLERNLIDFEDLLELTIQMFQNDPYALERFSEKYKAFTVDEYQDVNLLQETLLREWLGERDDLCVVGDDYQSIYGFTGATPRYLLEVPKRFSNAKVIRLETNYRSTPQVLDVANRLVPHLGGAEKTLHAVNPDGPEPRIKLFTQANGELAFIVTRINELLAEGVAHEEIAILYRANFMSEDYEELLAAASIPYQVRDGAFLRRQTARRMLGSLRNSRSTSVGDDVRRLAEKAGYLESPPEGLGDQEITRQNDLARFIRLAEEFDGDGAGTDFVADLEKRFGGEGVGRGVNLLTLHRAKGLEFDAVFMPRLEEGVVPFKRSKAPDEIDEERRLFYVGITRARTHLFVTYVNDGKRKGSRFLAEITGGKTPAAVAKKQIPAETFPAEIGLELSLSGGYSGTVLEITDSGVAVELDGGSLMVVPFGERVTSGGKTKALGPPVSGAALAFESLKRWRLERAKSDGVPAYVVFHDSTLQDIADSNPSSVEQLAQVAGVGPTKLERYGDDVLKVLAEVGSAESTAR